MSYRVTRAILKVCWSLKRCLRAVFFVAGSIVSGTPQLSSTTTLRWRYEPLLLPSLWNRHLDRTECNEMDINCCWGFISHCSSCLSTHPPKRKRKTQSYLQIMFRNSWPSESNGARNIVWCCFKCAMQHVYYSIHLHNRFYDVQHQYDILFYILCVCVCFSESWEFPLLTTWWRGFFLLQNWAVSLFLSSLLLGKRWKCSNLKGQLSLKCFCVHALMYIDIRAII